MIDVLTFVIFFAVTVLYLLKRNTFHNRKVVNSSTGEENEFEDSNSEFEEGDTDENVDEMPDDCLIYDDLFDEE